MYLSLMQTLWETNEVKETLADIRYLLPEAVLSDSCTKNEDKEKIQIYKFPDMVFIRRLYEE